MSERLASRGLLPIQGWRPLIAPNALETPEHRADIPIVPLPTKVMSVKLALRVTGIAVLCAIGWAAHAPAASARLPFPGCSWPVESTPTSANVLYPDSNSTYWTTPYRVRPGMQIYLRGRYPTARYFSIQAYDNNAQPYSVSGVASSLTDYQIKPSIGRNPWSPAGAVTASKGRYEITLRSLSRRASTAAFGVRRNTLPIAPANPTSGDLPGDIGFLMIRVYLPPQLNFSAVPLPSISIKARGEAAVTLPRCGSRHGTKILGSSKLGKRILTLVKGKSSAPPAPCPPGATGCPPNLQFFVPPSGNDIPFPNTTSGYAAAFFTPQAGRVVVIQAKVPTSPFDYHGGERPAPWPRNDRARWQVRYWSLCNYLYVKPFPVVVAPGPNGSTLYGCAADLQVPTTGQGSATVVLSYPDDRPSNATAANGIAWLPMSTSDPTAVEQVSLRNMLISTTFKQSPKSATGSSVADAQQALGAYYPRTAMCDVATFETGGAAACLAEGTTGLG